MVNMNVPKPWRSQSHEYPKAIVFYPWSNCQLYYYGQEQFFSNISESNKNLLREEDQARKD